MIEIIHCCLFRIPSLLLFDWSGLCQCQFAITSFKSSLHSFLRTFFSFLNCLIPEGWSWLNPKARGEHVVLIFWIWQSFSLFIFTLSSSSFSSSSSPSLSKLRTHYVCVHALKLLKILSPVADAFVWTRQQHKKNLNATFSNFGANCDKTSRAEPPTDLKSANLSKQKQPYPSACSLPTPIWDIVVQWSATRFSTCPERASWRRSRCPLHPSVWKGSVDLGRSEFSAGWPTGCMLRRPFPSCTRSLSVYRLILGGVLEGNELNFWENSFRSVLLLFSNFAPFLTRLSVVPPISPKIWHSLPFHRLRKRFLLVNCDFFDVSGIGCLLVEGWPDSVLLEFFFLITYCLKSTQTGILTSTHVQFRW